MDIEISRKPTRLNQQLAKVVLHQLRDYSMSSGGNGGTVDTRNSALVFGGRFPSPAASALTEEWNGTVWSEVGDLNADIELGEVQEEADIKLIKDLMSAKKKPLIYNNPRLRVQIPGHDEVSNLPWHKDIHYNKIKRINSKKEVVIGFGITEKTISKLKSADGLVVGSAICKEITRSLKSRQNPVTNVGRLVNKLKNKIK